MSPQFMGVGFHGGRWRGKQHKGTHQGCLPALLLLGMAVCLGEWGGMGHMSHSAAGLGVPTVPPRQEGNGGAAGGSSTPPPLVLIPPCSVSLKWGAAVRFPSLEEGMWGTGAASSCAALPAAASPGST